MSEQAIPDSNKQLERVNIAGIIMTEQEQKEYMAMPDDLGEFKEGIEISVGYKKCGGCKHILKLYMYNVNNASKNKCTGNCKACQKIAASKSYNKTKGNRNYKEYYAINKERKQEHGRQYYQENKDKILEKQKQYHSSSAGRKVMRKSHGKRRKLLNNNKGIPYKREWIIDRDKQGNEFPTCYLCGEPIKHARELHLDHVVAIVLGGKDCFTNIACTHQLCNLRKTKDCREISVSSVETIIELSENYIDEHPELFEEKSETEKAD